ncbi:MAG TPA: FecR domain-containing protein [Ferruginibacter sp.]|nr:FecR domain-containing protein [Ferruginibacter sp.]
MKEEKFWLLLSKKITGEATAEELLLLEELLQHNPEWQATLETLQEFWNSRPAVNSIDNQQKANDAYLSHVNRLKGQVLDFGNTEEVTAYRIEAPVRKPFYKRLATYAVAVSLVAALSLVYFLSANADHGKLATVSENPANKIMVEQGSRTKIQLPDGSQVWVNSGSTISYENFYKANTREVQLNGEAYFDVVRDPEHPFIVHTSGIDIKVLGTAFNVKAYQAESTIEATLIHGSIEVINKNRPGSPKIMLKPHEKLVYSKYPVADTRDQRAEVKPAEPDAYSITIKPLSKEIADSNIVETAWVYNKLSFEDERFEDLAHKMEKWYNLRIVIENEKLKNYRISGSFINETPEEALKELQFLVPFSYVLKNNEVRITRK